ERLREAGIDCGGMKIELSLCVWAFAAAAACGSVSSNQVDAGNGMGDATAPGDFSLAANPGTLALNITGEGTVAVDLSRGAGFTDAVSRCVTGLPTGVRAAFAADSLPDGTTTTDLTITVDETATAGTTDLTITGTAGDL